MSTNADMHEKNGFSLVEVMVATMVITVGLLAMAASTGYVSAQLRSTTFDTRRTAATQQVVERLRASTYTSLPTAASPLSTTIGDYTLTAVADTFVMSNVAQVRVITAGPAYRQGMGSVTQVTDTIVFIIPRPHS